MDFKIHFYQTLNKKWAFSVFGVISDGYEFLSDALEAARRIALREYNSIMQTQEGSDG